MEHVEVLSKYKADMQSREMAEGRRPSKKRKIITQYAITNCFGSKNPYKKEDMSQQRFLEDLVLYLAKRYRPLTIVENAWLRRLVICQYPRVVFLSRKQLFEHVFSDRVAKTMEKYVLPSLVGCVTTTTPFDS